MIRSGFPCRIRLVPGPLAAFGAMALGLTAVAARAEPGHPGDPVLLWNDQTNRAIQETATDPFQASRDLALESIAVLDTVRSIASAPCFLVRLPGARDLDPTIAAAAAAHTMLVRLFPARRAVLDAALETSLADVPAGSARDRATAFGNAVAEAVYARREDDGWNAKGPPDANAASAEPVAGQWRPTPPGFLPSQEPQWGTIQPFVLARPSQFRPAGPPATGSASFRDAAAAVAAVGDAQSTDRTADQTEIARYWSDPAGTYGPAGHWNAIAASLIAPSGQSLEAEAQTFTELNVAIADAAIAVADAKYNFLFWRPVTVIREGGAGAPANPTWSPLLETPSQPGYVSEQASFGGAAATVLTDRLGEHGFSLASAGLPGVTRSFANFQQAAEEAAAGPQYGGIQYSFDQVDGLATGRAVGAWTLAAFQRIGQDRGPVIVMDRKAIPGRQKGQPLTGFAVDNFSPVKTVTVRVDEGERFNVAVDDKGRFILPRLHPGRFGQMEAVLVATSATGRAAVARLELDGATPGSMVTAPFTVK